MYTAFVVFRSGHTGVYTLLDPIVPEGLPNCSWLYAHIDRGGVEAWTYINASQVDSIVITRGGNSEDALTT
jgi:hypothetical protein